MPNKDYPALRSCPFCGGEARLRYRKPLGWVQCKKCGATSAAVSDYYEETDGKGQAIAAWNRRADHIRDTTKKVSNADRIRGMSDEELAAIIAADVTEEKLNYCQNKPECSAILETADGIISDEWCIQCALDWLTAETEGTE